VGRIRTCAAEAI